MATRNQKRIREILGEEETASDTSLRAQTWRRAQGASPPRTLTPFEWEQWYAEHGVPESHRRELPAKRAWWRRLLRR